MKCEPKTPFTSVIAKGKYIAIMVTVFLCHSLLGQDLDSDTDLYDVALEDLMNLEVTSLSKKSEKVQTATASIYILTSEDISKSGATNLHELLRIVPGYWGAQDQYSSVSPGIRISRPANDFNGTVLYLLDGTPILNQMSSSLSFKNFDIPISDIDRIEVIRGSGGTIYGANSATGVVNIFTKDPEKNKGIHVNGEGAHPGYAAASLSAGVSLSSKLEGALYAKLRFFDGFESIAGKDEDGNKVVPSSRFARNYDESTTSSIGLKLDYELSDRTQLSLRSHFNALSKHEYFNYIKGDSFDIVNRKILSDNLEERDLELDRLVSSIRLDHSFSDGHGLFFRISTNRENDYGSFGQGGYLVRNAMYDVELQDNLSIGNSNDLSFGGNYRLVHFNIYDIRFPEGINYKDPQSTESLKGVFVQNRTSLLNDELQVTLGVKAENYTLINDKFYISPMAKVAYSPVENLTFWGGFTQSFTTPGFNLTNTDLGLFLVPTSDEVWKSTATKFIYQGVYQEAYFRAIDSGASEAAAAEAADNAAKGYLATPEGQAEVVGYIPELKKQIVDVAIRLGDTEPVRFRTGEFGIRANLSGQLYLESNAFYTSTFGGLSLSKYSHYEESPSRPGKFADYLVYGNFLNGETYGMESMVRFRPFDRMFFELAHTFLKTTWKFDDSSEADDDNILIDPTATPSVPDMPKHTFKFRSSYDFGGGFSTNLGIIHVSKFASEKKYMLDKERYASPFANESGTLVAKNKHRTIVSLRFQKDFSGTGLSIYAFGNDIFNKGIIAQTNELSNITLSKIGAMYGLGLNYNWNK